MRVMAAGRPLALDPEHPTIMGIVNVGEDSVADPLRLWALEDQVLAARGQIEAGAAIIDIGAQSGRTDTGPLSVEREIEMLTPLVEALAAEDVAISVDTWRAEVAAAMVAAGASVINDVSGLADPEMASVAAQSGAALVLMHTRAAPKTVRFPGYEDPVADVEEMLGELIEQALTAGVAAEQLILDPGLDFAKTPQESIEVMRRLSEFGGSSALCFWPSRASTFLACSPAAARWTAWPARLPRCPSEWTRARRSCGSTMSRRWPTSLRSERRCAVSGLARDGRRSIRPDAQVAAAEAARRKQWQASRRRGTGRLRNHGEGGRAWRSNRRRCQGNASRRTSSPHACDSGSPSRSWQVDAVSAAPRSAFSSDVLARRGWR